MTPYDCCWIHESVEILPLTDWVHVVVGINMLMPYLFLSILCIALCNSGVIARPTSMWACLCRSLTFPRRGGAKNVN